MSGKLRFLCLLLLGILIVGATSAQIYKARHVGAVENILLLDRRFGTNGVVLYRTNQRGDSSISVGGRDYHGKIDASKFVNAFDDLSLSSWGSDRIGTASGILFGVHGVKRDVAAFIPIHNDEPKTLPARLALKLEKDVEDAVGEPESSRFMASCAIRQLRIELTGGLRRDLPSLVFNSNGNTMISRAGTLPPSEQIPWPQVRAEIKRSHFSLAGSGSGFSDSIGADVTLSCSQRRVEYHYADLNNAPDDVRNGIGSLEKLAIH